MKLFWYWFIEFIWGVVWVKSEEFWEIKEFIGSFLGSILFWGIVSATKFEKGSDGFESKTGLRIWFVFVVEFKDGEFNGEDKEFEDEVEDDRKEVGFCWNWRFVGLDIETKLSFNERSSSFGFDACCSDNTFEVELEVEVEDGLRKSWNELSWRVGWSPSRSIEIKLVFWVCGTCFCCVCWEVCFICWVAFVVVVVWVEGFDKN